MGIGCLPQLLQGVKLRNIIRFPIGDPPLKIGFPKLFEAFRMEAADLNIDFNRVSNRKPLSRNWVSGSVFGCPGNPETQ